MNGRGLAVIGVITIVVTALVGMLLFNRFFSPVINASVGIADILPFVLLAGAIIVIGVVIRAGDSF